MSLSAKSIIACGCLGAVILATAACSPRRIPPMTVNDLMEDRVTLDGVLMKCNQSQSKARTDVECLNARIAIDRLASRSDPAQEAKRMEEFEHTRDQLRLAQEKQRKEREARSKVDVYSLPLAPVEPAPAQPPSPNDAPPPIVRESNP
jgi:hypothetical protein